MLTHSQQAGAVRADVSALDVMMLVKGVCAATSAFQQVESEMVERHLDLLWAALTAPAGAQPLRGRTPTLQDIERSGASSAVDHQ
jgi:hypothetical protein